MGQTIHRPRRLNIGIIAFALSLLSFGAGLGVMFDASGDSRTRPPSAPTAEDLIALESQERFDVMAEYSIAFIKYRRELDGRILRVINSMLLCLIAAPLAVVACYETWLAYTPRPTPPTPTDDSPTPGPHPR